VAAEPSEGISCGIRFFFIFLLVSGGWIDDSVDLGVVFVFMEVELELELKLRSGMYVVDC